MGGVNIGGLEASGVEAGCVWIDGGGRRGQEKINRVVLVEREGESPPAS